MISQASRLSDLKLKTGCRVIIQLLRQSKAVTAQGETEVGRGSSAAGDLHAIEKDGTDLFGATTEGVAADRDDAAEHVAQIAGDGDFLDRMAISPPSTQ